MNPSSMSAPPLYRKGNIVISSTRLTVNNEAVPLANVVGVACGTAHRPRRYWTPLLLAAAAIVMLGVRFAHESWGWPVMAAGLLLGLWTWFVHRQTVWLVDVKLLLRQHTRILFQDGADAEEFVSALESAKRRG
jgi:hypothetical protein